MGIIIARVRPKMANRTRGIIPFAYIILHYIAVAIGLQTTKRFISIRWQKLSNIKVYYMHSIILYRIHISATAYAHVHIC